MKKKQLHLIEKPAELSESNSFWNCCPLKNTRMPSKSCPEGIPKVEKNKILCEPRCLWWINSEKDSFCFWNYIKRMSKVDGSMPELSQSDLAKLLGWSNTKTHFILKEAMDELTKVLKYNQFDVELSDLQEFFDMSHDLKDIVTNFDD